MKFTNNCTCEFCGGVCNVMSARLEWLKERTSPYRPISIHLCHKECSMGTMMQELLCRRLT